MLLRDYHDEASSTLFCMEPMWSHECFSMWADNVPRASANAESQIAKADSQIEMLGKETRKTMWETDTMKLARDVAVLGRMYADTVKSDAAKRLRKITHLKQQNVVGSNLVTNWMEQTCRFVGGIQKDLESSLNKALNAMKHPCFPIDVSKQTVGTVIRVVAVAFIMQLGLHCMCTTQLP